MAHRVVSPQETIRHAFISSFYRFQTKKTHKKKRDVFRCVKTFLVKSNDAASFFFILSLNGKTSEKNMLFCFSFRFYRLTTKIAVSLGVSRPLCKVSKEALKPRNLVLAQHVVYRR